MPLQDVLSLGSEARLNIPSTATGNYHWRYQPGALKPDLAEKLAALAEVTDRLAGASVLIPRCRRLRRIKKAGIFRFRLSVVGWFARIKSARVGRTLLSDVFDFALILILRTKDQPKAKSIGQECPTHTNP